MTTSRRPRRLTRAESKARTHKALLGAARDAFSEQGYQGATVDLIAARAGYTKGAFYAHFDRKEDLFLELLEETLGRRIDELNSLLARVGDNPDDLIQALDRWLGRVDEDDDPGRLGLELQIESRRNPDFASAFGPVIVQHQKAIGAILAHYYKVTGKRPILPLDKLATVLIGVPVGLALARQASVGMPAAQTAPVLRRILGIS